MARLIPRTVAATTWRDPVMVRTTEGPHRFDGRRVRVELQVQVKLRPWHPRLWWWWIKLRLGGTVRYRGMVLEPGPTAPDQLP